jgi:hypothetical protein
LNKIVYGASEIAAVVAISPHFHATHERVNTGHLATFASRAGLGSEDLAPPLTCAECSVRAPKKSPDQLRSPSLVSLARLCSQSGWSETVFGLTATDRE